MHTYIRTRGGWYIRSPIDAGYFIIFKAMLGVSLVPCNMDSQKCETKLLMKKE